MPNDRELLELAAKAAGIRVAHHAGVSYDTTGMHEAMNILAAPKWNPLTDDGAALRLAVNLGISIDPGADHVCAITAGHKHVVVERGDGGMLFQAARRAIVRAAAEIGKTM